MSGPKKVDTKKLMGEFKAWQTGVEVAAVQDELAREEASVLRQERDQLQKELHEEAYPRIQKLLDMQKQLVDNYASLLPIIEIKRRLAAQVTTLKSEQQEANEVHKEEVTRLVAQMETQRSDGEKKLQQAVEEAHNKAKEVEAAHKETLAIKDKEIQGAKEEIQKEQNKHRGEISGLQKQSHEDEGHLVNRILQLQQNRSSQATANRDIFANKLQATRAEYEKHLEQKDAQLDQLREDLQCVEEKLRHQQQLSVVRDVATTSSSSSKSLKGTPMPSPTATSPASTCETPPIQENESVEESEEDKDLLSPGEDLQSMPTPQRILRKTVNRANPKATKKAHLKPKKLPPTRQLYAEKHLETSNAMDE